MRAVDLINKKRAGLRHGHGEIASLVAGYLRNDIPDYQMSAWLMAVCWRCLSTARHPLQTMARALVAPCVRSTPTVRWGIFILYGSTPIATSQIFRFPIRFTPLRPTPVLSPPVKLCSPTNSSPPSGGKKTNSTSQVSIASRVKLSPS
ncbi:MAG: hypothetical protein EBV53_07005 [Proteobacteria bacterium]|nr:hypothetical protein [Pseudomonadota bacterium]